MPENGYTRFLDSPIWRMAADDALAAPIVEAYGRATGRTPAPTDIAHGFYGLWHENKTLAQLESEWRRASKPPPPPPGASGDLVTRPIVGDFLGPLPDGLTAGIMGTGYLSLALVSIADSATRRAVLARHARNGARHFSIWAQWSTSADDGRGHFAAQQWAGDRTYDAYRDLDNFGRILDEIRGAGLSPIVFLAERADRTFGDFSADDVVEMARLMVDAHGDKIAWIAPEIETDEIRDANERGRLMRRLREVFPRVALHFSAHMPLQAHGYRDLPDDCLVLGQAPREANDYELRDYGRVVAYACPRTVINFEHSANKRLSGHSVADATRRAVILAEAGWQDTGNALSVEARIRCQLAYRKPSVEALTAAMPYLEVAVPGIIRASKDTVWYPGLRGGPGDPNSQRADLIQGATSDRPRWQWLIDGWDGRVRPV